MIDPAIWESEDVSKLTMTERVLLVGLISNSDDYGKGRANPARIRSVVFQYDDVPVDDVREMLANISRHVEITFYEIDGSEYYKFTNWRKWQKLDHPTESRIPEPLDGVRVLYANESRAASERLSHNRIEKKGIEKKGIEDICAPDGAPDAPKPMTQKEIDALFARFWSLYPRKRGKGQVRDATKRKLAEVGEEHLTRCIDRFKTDMKAQGRAMDTYPYGSTFFNTGYIDYLDGDYVPHDPGGGNGKKLDGLKYDQRPPGEDGLDRDYDDIAGAPERPRSGEKEGNHV
jgi:hypothetical protein